MPTENELKYVLNLHCEQAIEKIAFRKRLIRQGYLAFTKGLSLRIRDTDNKKYELTFKQKSQNRVIEIEKTIDKRDFDDLWEVSVNRLEKTRYDVLGLPDHKDSVWEVDAFKDHNHMTYLMMAEHEMEEHLSHPHFIPDFIDQNLVFAVPREDDRFSSKKIADVKYTKSLYLYILSLSSKE